MRLVQSQKRPVRGAVHQGDDLWLVPDDGEELEEGAVELEDTTARDAVPLRDDLDPEHPLHGKRALRNVPAGSSDIVISDAGELTADLSVVGVVAEVIG